MLRSLAGRPAARRRGAVLIVVLAMLVLFAVLGIGFVLYAESQRTVADGNRLAENKDSPPDALLAAEGWTGPFFYDVSDSGDDLLNPIRGHSLRRSKYSHLAGAGGDVPYSGSTPLPQENMAFGGGAFNLDSRQVVRFTWEQSTGNVFDPERVYGVNPVRTSPAAALPGTYQSKAYGYTYPDRHDLYLAQLDPTTGRITVPSFHRDALGSWNPADPNYFETQTGGQYKTLRPRRVEHPNFPAVPMNPDGSYTGDVQNFRFTAGGQRNDSYWMYAGGPVREWRGKRYAAFVAPLILDLNGRVNLSAAGNVANAGGHASHHALGGWEVNPTAVGVAAADVAAGVQRRHGRGGVNYDPPADPFTQALSTTRLNGGRVPPQHGLLDPSGVPATDGPLALPVAGTFTTTPAYPSRFPATQVNLNTRLQNHPAQFNPLVYGRGPAATTTPGGFGHDDLVKLLARYSDPKGRTVSATPGLNGLGGSAQTRALVTTFNAVQEWANARVPTNAAYTTFTTLGPVDLNRPLPDFRINTNAAPSPLNQHPAGSREHQLARAARQNLARDIFVRLMVSAGHMALGAYYDPVSGGPVFAGAVAPGELTYLEVMALARLAANIVDYIDGDDVNTLFVFNPVSANYVVPGSAPAIIDPSADPANYATAELQSGNRVAFGTEAPRLVINEVYTSLHNDRTETTLVAPFRAQRAYSRKYWIELHNPLPAEAETLPAVAAAVAARAPRADGGAARLRYTATSLVPDSAGVLSPAGVTYNPYRVEVGVGGFNHDLNAGSQAALDPTDMYARIDTFTADPMAVDPSPLAGDELNLVRPAGGGTPSANDGYYLLGPRDRHPAATPAPNVPKNTLSLGDGAYIAGNPPAADALTVSFGTAPPAAPDATVEGTVVLRRLLNPYLPPQLDRTLTNFNPYITVDIQNNIPTRDKVRYTAGGNHNVTDDGGSFGRIHPLASRGAVVQAPAAAPPTPPHTFFAPNEPRDNARGAVGFEWMAHPDRQLVSPFEVAHVSVFDPSNLTRRFYDGTSYQKHADNTLLTEGLGLGTLGVNGRKAWAVYGLLAAGDRGPAVPLGGRTAGKVNLNTATHAGVLRAALDRQAGHGYSAAEVDALWARLAPAVGPAGSFARTATPSGTADAAGPPGATVHEAGAGDRPFVAFAAAASSDDTLVRHDTLTPPNARLFSSPALPHPYQQAELLRRGSNTLNTTSDTFLVVFTVGFFEVTNAGTISVTNPPVFGAEVFDKVPGDLRAQFAGVFDRSQLAVTEAGAPADAPVQAKLLADVSAGGGQLAVECLPEGAALPAGVVGTSPVAAGTCALVFDGRAVAVRVGTRLHLGFGNAAAGTGNGEWVQVAAVTTGGAGSGRATLTLTAGVTYAHGGSEPVSNATFGTPAVLPTGVTLKQLAARGLVPYFTRLEP